MIYNYFRSKEKPRKILNFLINNQNPNIIDLSIKKKISKLNEFQFICLLGDVILHNHLSSLTIQTLECFFQYEDYENVFPFLNPEDTDDEDIKRLIEKEVCFNCKYELNYLIEYLLNTEEYPKQTQIHKLKFLNEKIIETIWRDLNIIQSIFSYYIENKENKNNIEKLNFIILILDAIENFKKLLSANIDTLEEEIKKLSNPNYKKESVFLKVDEEVLKKIYFKLVKNEFIDMDKTFLAHFIEVFTLDCNSHNSIIYFEMDNIQFRYFIDCINDHFNTKISMSSIQYSGKIKCKNGIINARSVNTSYNKKLSEPKKHEIIKNIFDDLKKG